MKKKAIIIFLFTHTIIYAQNYNDNFVEAIRNNDIEKIQLMIKQGIDLNKKWGPLHYPYLIAGIRSTKLEIVKILIEAGASIDAVDVYGETPLMNSTAVGNYEITEYLIKNKANVNHTNYDGLSVLDAALLTNKLSIWKLLIENGADPHRKNNNGFNILFRVMIRGTPEILATLLEIGFDPKEKVNNISALQFAKFFGNIKIIEFLEIKGYNLTDFTE